MTCASCTINLPSIVSCTHSRAIIPSCSIEVGCIFLLIPCLIISILRSDLLPTCILVMLTGHAPATINAIFLHRSNSCKLEPICSIDNLIVFEAVTLREIANFNVSLNEPPQYEFFSLAIFSGRSYLNITM
jgi:hypothetical protein